MTQPTSITTAMQGIRRLYANDLELLSKFNPGAQAVFCRDTEKCHFGNAPTLGLVEAAYGNATAQSWLKIQILNLSEFAGCKDKLTLTQISETARLILDGYPHYKLTEFMLFFQRFKLCRYGKFYGAVDPMVILQALAAFNEERAQMFAERRRREHQAQQQDEDRELRRLRQRYSERVPDAFTPAAPLNFIQYRLMGYDTMSDAELSAELLDIKAGRKSIPADVRGILATLQTAFGITG